ncbi:MAG: hypothetical protein MUC59_04005 [Saprospiraceae bacterium]|jgi:hypothetical protein|nr:hypothetical protein [Saprospiraceae bacterium]
MKRTALLSLIILAFFSCKKETEPPLTRITVGNLKFAVDPSIQPPLTYYIPINNVNMNAFAQLDGANIDTADIKNILPGRCTLTALFGGGNLDFIDAVSVRLCPQTDNGENCGREAFYRDPTPFDVGQELELVPSAVNDIRDMVLQKTINVQVKLERLRDVPLGSFEVVLEMEFDVR